MSNRLHILKVQLPIASNNPHALPMVYNKERTHEKFQRIPPVMMKAMVKDGVVQDYYIGEWNVILDIWLFMAPLKRVETHQSW